MSIHAFMRDPDRLHRLLDDPHRPIQLAFRPRRSRRSPMELPLVAWHH